MSLGTGIKLRMNSLSRHSNLFYTCVCCRFDLWEEVSSSSFFTTAVQHRSLRQGVALANAIGQASVVSGYTTQADNLLCFLQVCTSLTYDAFDPDMIYIYAIISHTGIPQGTLPLIPVVVGRVRMPTLYWQVSILSMQRQVCSSSWLCCVHVYMKLISFRL